MDDPLEHRFLTGGPWIPKGSVERALWVREDHKNKLCILLNFFYRYSGVLHQWYTLMVQGSVEIFLTFRGPWSKKG